MNTREDVKPEDRRLDGVDLLRGLAILFVLTNHLNMRLLGAKVPYTAGLPDQLVSSPDAYLSGAGVLSVVCGLGKPLRLVPALFVAAVTGAGLLGALVARLYSEPMNGYLGRRWCGKRGT